MTYLIDTNTFRKFGLAVLGAALLAAHGAQAEAPTNAGVVAGPVAVAPAPVVSRKSAAPAAAPARLARQSGIGLVLGVGF